MRISCFDFTPLHAYIARVMSLIAAIFMLVFMTELIAWIGRYRRCTYEVTVTCTLRDCKRFLVAILAHAIVCSVILLRMFMVRTTYGSQRVQNAHAGVAHTSSIYTDAFSILTTTSCTSASCLPPSFGQ
ncbi:hypothetical protein B0H21DRAFT_197559 [Amylocystis lapponica]|nr:hypothetical protein B0H21DRAFT_197559 [Amylocystis lapponica]